MNQKRPDFSQLMGDPRAASILNDKQAVEDLVHSGEAQRLMELLDKNAGGGLKQAAQSALKGDSARLMALVEGLMRDPQGAKLVQDLKGKFSK